MRFYIKDVYIDVNKDSIHIHNSYKVTASEEIKKIIDTFLVVNNNILKTRSKKSIINEWKAHNVLYKLHIKRNSTMHTDIEVKQDLFHKICYFILSLFYWK